MLQWCKQLKEATSRRFRGVLVQTISLTRHLTHAQLTSKHIWTCKIRYNLTSQRGKKPWPLISIFLEDGQSKFSLNVSRYILPLFHRAYLQPKTLLKQLQTINKNGLLCLSFPTDKDIFFGYWEKSVLNIRHRKFSGLNGIHGHYSHPPPPKKKKKILIRKCRNSSFEMLIRLTYCCCFLNDKTIGIIFEGQQLFC